MIVEKDYVKFVTRTDLAVAINELIDQYNSHDWTLKLNIVCKEYDDNVKFVLERFKAIYKRRNETKGLSYTLTEDERRLSGQLVSVKWKINVCTSQELYDITDENIDRLIILADCFESSAYELLSRLNDNDEPQVVIALQDLKMSDINELKKVIKNVHDLHTQLADLRDRVFLETKHKDKKNIKFKDMLTIENAMLVVYTYEDILNKKLEHCEFREKYLDNSK